MKFDKYRISQELKDNLIAIGFHRSTDIQFKAIPPIMNGEDVLAIAQTGTGKTGAFAIPVINSIQEFKEAAKNNKAIKGKVNTKFIKCLVLVPTRELTKQIGKVFSQLSKNTKVTSYAVYGGVEQDPQIRQLEGGIDILIATPGRMFDLIAQGFIEVSKVKTLVLDEADRMLDLGFIKDINSIKTKLPRRHQTLFFSATINPKIKKLAYSQISSSAMRIQVSPENLVSQNISHFVTKVEMDEKRHLLVNFIKEAPEAKLIVFVRTQVRAERVLNHLLKNEIPAVNIHGGMDQKERESSLESFRDLKSGVLIATDVSARGIDLPGITHVINYDLPDDPENYVHRVGRTGRGFNKGDALSFCATEEKEKLKLIEEFIQTKIPELKAQAGFRTEQVVLKDLDDDQDASLRDLLSKNSDEKSKSKLKKQMSISEMLALEESIAYGTKLKKRKKKK
jgi:ATP-dependent RNA helicase RhlE